MTLREIGERIRSSQIFQSIFRHGRPDTSRNRVLVIISNVFLHIHPTFVRRHGLRFAYTFGLGGLSFFAFLALTVTGVVLMFYYRPFPEVAYRDMKDLAFAVPYGRVLRNAHRWAAHAMVLVVILHMARVFYTGSYRPPREFNWVVGVGLLFMTLLLSFTGYLLPWDQLAFWAITVGTNMARSTPFIGHEGPFASLVGARIDNDVRFMLLGGVEVGQAALIRFYVLHCVVLPLAAILLLTVHFWRVRKDGGISGPIDPLPPSA
ncbi:MAG: cytochrome b N-terminal domain-containing protein [Myxococcota bacterium]